MYSFGDGVKNVELSIFYIEGDLDYLVNRGMLCLKGVGLVDIIYSKLCLFYFEYCVLGFNEWKWLSWDDVLDCIVWLMKEDCDVNFVQKNEVGQMVNCWLIIGMLVVLVISNEIVVLIYKVVCFLGMLVFDNQVCV